MRSKLESDYSQRLDEYMLELLEEAEAAAAEQWLLSHHWHITLDGNGLKQQKYGKNILTETDLERPKLFFPIVKREDLF